MVFLDSNAGLTTWVTASMRLWKYPCKEARHNSTPLEALAHKPLLDPGQIQALNPEVSEGTEGWGTFISL